MVKGRRTVVLTGAIAVVAALSGIASAYADTGTPPAFLRTLGGPGHAPVYPGGLEVAADGGLVVADTGNSRVAKYSPTTGNVIWSTGTPGSGMNQFLNPRDVGIDIASGEIYVADDANGRIVMLDSTGHWLGAFRGPAGSMMGAPIGVSSSGGKVYVADPVHHQARVYDLQGNQLNVFSSQPGCVITRVRDVAADAAGNLYLANYESNNILKLSPTGACLKAWGTKGTGNGQFKNPYGVTIAVDPLLNGGVEAVYVADSNNDRIQEFTTGGTYVAKMGTQGTAPGTFTQLRRVAVARDGTGDVWGADLWGFRLERFHRLATPPFYGYAQTIGGTPPPLNSTQTFNMPHGIGFDAAGNLFVVDTVNQRLIHMQPDGTILGSCGQRGSQLGQENWPRGAAVDLVTGDVWIADTKQSNIQIIKPDCTAVAQLGTAGPRLNQFNWPFSIAIRQSDHIAFIADTLNNRIVSYDVATRAPIASYSGGTSIGPLKKPAGIAISAANGHIMVADSGNNRVLELADTGGGSISAVRAMGDGGGFSNPSGIAADTTGRIYVADSGNSRVVVLNPDGSELATMTSFSQPENLAVDSTNTLYVADTFNDRIQVYAYASIKGSAQP